MASKRTIKKGLNNMVFDIVEDCFSIQLFDDAKTAASEKVIDDVAAFQDDILAKINKANNKVDFRAIRSEIDAKGEAFFQTVNAI